MWAAIPGYEGLYEASTSGSIRSIDRVVPCRRYGTRKRRSFVLKPSYAGCGYLGVTLSKNNVHKSILVHHAVFDAHTRIRRTGLEINHKDGIKDNNALANLELTTPAGNKIHATANGLGDMAEKPIRCVELGYVARSMRAMQRWLKGNGYPTAHRAAMLLVVQGKQSAHLGLRFEAVAA